LTIIRPPVISRLFARLTMPHHHRFMAAAKFPIRHRCWEKKKRKEWEKERTGRRGPRDKDWLSLAGFTEKANCLREKARPRIFFDA
jgi:hypothetical protein